jgi:hypothetical protein
MLRRRLFSFTRFSIKRTVKPEYKRKVEDEFYLP